MRGARLFSIVTFALLLNEVAHEGFKRVVQTISYFPYFVSVVVMGTACLASAFSPDLPTLTAWRFVTGLGLGAAMPNAITMMSEVISDSHFARLAGCLDFTNSGTATPRTFGSGH